MTPRHPQGALGGRVAAVTGGSSGIGLALAAALASEGAAVAVWSRRPDPPQVRALRAAHPDRVLPVRCDVTVPSDVTAALRATLAAFGRLDCGITAAGVNAPQPFTTTTLDAFRTTLAVNLHGTFLVLRSMARHLAVHGGGSLLAVSSIAGLRGQATTADYAATKAAVAALVRSIAVELAPQGVRANILTPGYVRTPLLEPYLAADRFVRSVTARVPLRRVADPAELAALGVLLAGPGGAGISGTEFVADGGFTVEGGLPSP